MTKEKKGKKRNIWNWMDGFRGDKVVLIIALLLMLISVISVPGRQGGADHRPAPHAHFRHFRVLLHPAAGHRDRRGPHRHHDHPAQGGGARRAGDPPAVHLRPERALPLGGQVVLSPVPGDARHPGLQPEPRRKANSSSTSSSRRWRRSYSPGPPGRLERNSSTSTSPPS